MKRSALLAALILALAAPAALAEDGDAANGQVLAKEKCSRCHDINKGAAFKMMPPSFQSIAIYRTKMDIWGRIVSPSPHIAMPDMKWALNPEEVQDLLAYILSLDQPVTLQK